MILRKREREREIETEKESDQAKPPGTSAPTQAWARQASRHLEHAAAGEEKETEAENDIEKEKETETEEERGRDEAATRPRRSPFLEFLCQKSSSYTHAQHTRVCNSYVNGGGTRPRRGRGRTPC